MKTLSRVEVKNELSKLVDRVETLQEDIMITRNGRPAAVMVGPEEYEGWKGTLAIRSDTVFMEEIRRGSGRSRRSRSSTTGSRTSPD